MSLAVALLEKMLDSHGVQQEPLGTVEPCPHVLCDLVVMAQLQVAGVALVLEVAWDQVAFLQGEGLSLGSK